MIEEYGFRHIYYRSEKFYSWKGKSGIPDIFI